LDFGIGKATPLEVCDFHEEKYYKDALTLSNNSKHHFCFLIEQIPNPKFEFDVKPNSGEIKKGQSTTVNFSLRVFCTTKLYQVVKVILYPPKSGLGRLFGNSSNLLKERVRNTSSFRHQKQNSLTETGLEDTQEEEEEEISHFYISFKIESELSTSLDFDEIKLDEPIASGGFGTVFKATWRDSEVAVKMLNIQDLTTDEREFVKREIRLMSKLNHAYIVTYMGSTQIKGQPLTIVMEYIKGGSLTKLLHSAPLDDFFKSKLALDVAKGMSFLHSNNIYHRDIKPDNMLVVSSHRDTAVNLKITDFGTSKASTRAAFKDSNYYSIKSVHSDRSYYSDNALQKNERIHSKGVGTLIYQAPEILNGQSDYSIDKTDIFSFGVLLWEVFTQRIPFEDPPYNNFTAKEIENFVRTGNRLEIPSTIASKIASLIRCCWDQEPKNRPTFPYLVKELNEYMDSLPNSKTVNDANSSCDSFQDDGISSPSKLSETVSIQRLSESISSPVERTIQQPKEENHIPIPRGNLVELGWCGDISRTEVDRLLKDKLPGTFLIRWSYNTQSYVLSYNSNNKTILHIAYITPGRNEEIYVNKEDGTKTLYLTLFDYLNVLKKAGVITSSVSETGK